MRPTTALPIPVLNRTTRFVLPCKPAPTVADVRTLDVWTLLDGSAGRFAERWTHYSLPGAAHRRTTFRLWTVLFADDPVYMPLPQHQPCERWLRMHETVWAACPPPHCADCPRQPPPPPPTRTIWLTRSLCYAACCVGRVFSTPTPHAPLPRDLRHSWCLYPTHPTRTPQPPPTVQLVNCLVYTRLFHGQFLVHSSPSGLTQTGTPIAHLWISLLVAFPIATSSL